MLALYQVESENERIGKRKGEHPFLSCHFSDSPFPAVRE